MAKYMRDYDSEIFDEDNVYDAVEEVIDDDDMEEVMSETREEIYEDVIFGLNELLGGMADQGCMLDDELDRWCELMKKFRKAKGFE